MRTADYQHATQELRELNEILGDLHGTLEQLKKARYMGYRGIVCSHRNGWAMDIIERSGFQVFRKHPFDVIDTVLIRS